MQKIKKFLMTWLTCLSIGVSAVGMTGCNEVLDYLGNLIPNFKTEEQKWGDKESEGLVYELSDDGTYCIVKGMGTCTDEHLVIPAEYEGVPVKEINGFYGDGYLEFMIKMMEKMGVLVSEEEIAVFKDSVDYVSTPIKSIVLPDSIIELNAFYGLKTLERVNIGNAQFGALNGDEHPNPLFPLCFNIEEIVVAETNESYSVQGLNIYSKDGKTLFWAFGGSISDVTETIISGTGAFASYKDTKIVIPDSVTHIGNAFASCMYLKEIEIGSGVTEMDYEFYNCFNLEKITVDANNANYSSWEGNLYNKAKTTLLKYAIAQETTSFTIPNSVTKIENNAFAYCTNLTEVVIGANVTTIGYGAFEYCNNLTSIRFEGTVEQWNAIEKYSWNDDMPVMEVVCSDGSVSLIENDEA